MPIFESKGLLNGRRLRRLSPESHALWPFVFSLASERYARLEIDPELILDRLGHLRDLLRKETDPYEDQLPPERLTRIVDEYVACNLAFPYTVAGVPWIIFDKPNKLRKDYETRDDVDSPAPPEPEYTEWLQKLHGDVWADFHFGQMEMTLSQKRKAVGRLGGLAKAGKLDSLTNSLPNQHLVEFASTKSTKSSLGLGVRRLDTLAGADRDRVITEEDFAREEA